MSKVLFIKSGFAPVEEKPGRVVCPRCGKKFAARGVPGDAKLMECPQCEWVAPLSSRVRRVEIARAKHKITVRCAYMGIGELISNSWIGEGEIPFAPGIEEVLYFNLSRGTVFIRLESQGEVFYQRDITQMPRKIEGSVVYHLLCECDEVSESVKEAFREELTKLPLAANIEGLFKMTRFSGYKREFYSYIPFHRNSIMIDPGFKKQAKRLRNAKNVPAVYDRSGLPQSKSIRRFLFNHPGFLFYMDELCTMWNIMQNHDMYLRFLKSECVFEILSNLYRHPAIEEYFRMYANARGVIGLLKELKSSGSAGRRAVEYVCMSDVQKKQIEAKLANGGQECFFSEYNAFSLPMVRTIFEKIPDCVIDGYAFNWLRSTGEYALVGGELDNCLTHRFTHSLPVLAVRSGEKCVAAIEISGKDIVQLKGYRNRDIKEEKLKCAIEKWRNKFGLNMNLYEDYYEDMPF